VAGIFRPGRSAELDAGKGKPLRACSACAAIEGPSSRRWQSGRRRAVLRADRRTNRLVTSRRGRISIACAVFSGRTAATLTTALARRYPDSRKPSSSQLIHPARRASAGGPWGPDPTCCNQTSARQIARTGIGRGRPTVRGAGSSRSAAVSDRSVSSALRNLDHRLRRTAVPPSSRGLSRADHCYNLPGLRRGLPRRARSMSRSRP